MIEGDPVATQKVASALAHANLEVVKARLESVSTDRGNFRGFDVVLDVGFADGYDDCLEQHNEALTPEAPRSSSLGAARAQSERHVSGNDQSSVEFGGSGRLEYGRENSDGEQTKSENSISIGKLTIDTEAELVKVDGNRIKLSESEYQILELLCRNIGNTVTIDDFAQHLYGYSKQKPKLKIISVFVCRLRSKLKNALGGAGYIETVWGKGYVLIDPDCRS